MVATTQGEEKPAPVSRGTAGLWGWTWEEEPGHRADKEHLGKDHGVWGDRRREGS